MCNAPNIPNYIYFRCLDCDTSPPDGNSYELLCVPCFINSNHKGHSVVPIKCATSSSGYCDCG